VKWGCGISFVYQFKRRDVPTSPFLSELPSPRLVYVSAFPARICFPIEEALGLARFNARLYNRRSIRKLFATECGFLALGTSMAEVAVVARVAGWRRVRPIMCCRLDLRGEKPISHAGPGREARRIVMRATAAVLVRGRVELTCRITLDAHAQRGLTEADEVESVPIFWQGS